MRYITLLLTLTLSSLSELSLSQKESVIPDCQPSYYNFYYVCMYVYTNDLRTFAHGTQRGSCLLRDGWTACSAVPANFRAVVSATLRQNHDAFKQSTRRAPVGIHHLSLSVDIFLSHASSANVQSSLTGINRQTAFVEASRFRSKTLQRATSISNVYKKPSYR